MHSVENI